jgi:hypothetical protein
MLQVTSSSPFVPTINHAPPDPYRFAPASLGAVLKASSEPYWRSIAVEVQAMVCHSEMGESTGAMRPPVD